MNRKVLDTLEQYQMISQGDRVYTAVSGGADSVALLHVLWSLRGRLGFSLRALHLNHNLRGEESKRDEKFVRALCARMGVPLEVGSANIARLAQEKGLSVEECARRARYAFFRKCVGDQKNARIATAHTASDNVETVLLNLARGTGLRGLCGIPSVRDNVIRPLLRCSREEVEAYCRRWRLDYVTDSTNLSDDYTRNRIRHQAVPALREQNPSLEAAVMRLGDTLLLEDRYMESQARKALGEIHLGKDYFHREKFLQLHPALRPRILRILLIEKRLRYDTARLSLLENQIAKGSGGVQLSEMVYLHCDETSFVLRPPPLNSAPPTKGDSVELWVPKGEGEQSIACFAGKTIRLRCIGGNFSKKDRESNKKQFKNLLDCDKIEDTVILRHRRPGDRIRLAGRGCTKTVRRLLSEEKVPLALRWETLLLADGQGPVWLEGFGPAQSAAVTAETQRGIIIEVLEEQ